MSLQRMSNNIKENYIPPELTGPAIVTNINYNNGKTDLLNTPYINEYKYCNEFDLSKNFNDPYYISSNQKLAGGPQAKSNIPPIIAPPIADTEYWQPNDFVVPSGINSNATQDLYSSGYLISECCDKAPLFPEKAKRMSYVLQ